MTRLKISTIRFDGASEFGKSSSFIAYCKGHGIVLEPGLMRCDTFAAAKRATSQLGQGFACLWLVCHGPPATGTSSRDRYDVLLGNDLTTPNFWMYGFRAKKVMMLSDPKHWVRLSCSLGMFPIVSL
jgi:hypothetical protein